MGAKGVSVCVSVSTDPNTFDHIETDINAKTGGGQTDRQTLTLRLVEDRQTDINAKTG